MRAAGATIAFAAALSSASAGAHIGGSTGIAAFVDEAGAVRAAGTTGGLITRGDDGTFAQTCEEASGTERPRAYAEAGDGVVVATETGALLTVDRGCTWTPIAGVAAGPVTALASSPTSPGALWAVTASPDADNAVLFRDGAAFSPRATAPANTLLTSLVVARASIHGAPAEDVVVVAGAAPAAVGRRPVVLIVGGGGLLEEATVGAALDDAQLARVLTVDDGADLWFSTLDGVGRGHLWRAPLEAVVAGTAAPVRAGSFDGLVADTVTFGGAQLAIAGSGQLSTAPIDAARAGDARFTRVPMAPIACLELDGERLRACGGQTSPGWFLASTDGLTFDAAVAFDAVSDLSCPVGTPGSVACAYRFADPAPADPVVADDDAGGAGAADDAAGCAQAWSSPFAFVLAVAGARRRRPRR
jgi:hypothetical protein